MSKIFYNKLIRDLIPEKIANNKEKCKVRTITDDSEFQQELLKKVAEESSALSRARTREEFIDEYADLMVVLDTLTIHLELSEAEVSLALKENLERKGGYE
ncbi:MAG: nucleoside triphosphate pyrophosphohydrolase, partial [Candidatus Paceibacterota bacterium]